MNARSWFGLVLGTLMIPAASPVVGGNSRSSDTAYVVAVTQIHGWGGSDRSTSSVPDDVYGVSAASAHGEGNSLLDSEKCEAGDCARLRPAVFARIGVRRPERAALHSEESDSGSMSSLDFGLMLLIAMGLVAYQLDRKQRVLRQASFFSSASRLDVSSRV